MKLIHGFISATLAVTLCVPAAWAQAVPVAATPAKPNPETPSAHINVNIYPIQTIYLKNATQQADSNEIVTALRNALGADDKIYPVPSQNAIVFRASPEDVAVAQKLINELDRPKKNYRLTYTVTEMDGGKQIGTQHYAMVLASGQTTSLKLGNRVPVVTGPAGSQNAQYTYIDVGMNIDATLTGMGDYAMLKSSVDQSSVAPEKTDVGGGVQQPVVRQASLRGESFLAPGKSQALGSLDIPGSTSHLNVDVVMDPLP
jgi:hypothetical protein